MKYVYGPVKSRRLGLSLGVSLVPHKTCSFDCVYCQLGKTPAKTVERKGYIPASEIAEELRLWLQHHARQAKELDYITVSGAGEPTLNSDIGGVITRIKEMTTLPVALITNASFLACGDVRRQLLGADLIVPSLDAATAEAFRRVDRPHDKINIEEVIAGLIALSREFQGKIWLEVMLVKGLNDSLPQARKLKQAIDRINPDKVQLNSPVRTTAEEGVIALSPEKLAKIKEILGEKCEIV